MSIIWQFFLSLKLQNAESIKCLRHDVIFCYAPAMIMARALSVTPVRPSVRPYVRAYVCPDDVHSLN